MLGSIATATTAINHGLAVGSYINIEGATSPIQVAGIVNDAGTAVVTTVQPHDLTKNDYESHTPSFTIAGASPSDYNGTRVITSSDQLPDRNTIRFPLTNITATSPATGTITIDDGRDRGYNGRFEITAITDTTFSYVITSTNPPSLDATGVIKVHKDIK